MTGTDDVEQTDEERRAALLDNLRRAGESYREAEGVATQRRKSVETAIWLALNAGASPTDVAAASPFTPAYTRRVARAKRIPPAVGYTERAERLRRSVRNRGDSQP